MAPGDGRLERSAAEWLGLGDDRAQASLLGRLRDEDFLPDAVSHDAIRALRGAPDGATPWLTEEAARADELRLRGEVERFADEYFAITPVERRARWRSLSDSCRGHAALADRLRHLGRGLDVDRGEATRDIVPLVGRLADHACALFLLRPGPRAVACRALVGEIRDDQTIRDAELSRALKRLARRHRAVAALAPGFLTRLAQPRRPKRLRHWRGKLVLSSGSTPDNQTKPIGAGIWTVLIAVAVTSTLRIAITSRPSTGPSSAESSGRAPFPHSFAVGTNQKPFAGSLRAFRDRFKAPIRAELMRLDRTIDEPDLQRVVDALPVDDIPKFAETLPPDDRPEAGMAILRLLGYWTREVHDRYASALRQELARSGIVLDDAEFEQVARGCFPGPTKGPGRGPGPSGLVPRIPPLESP